VLVLRTGIARGDQNEIGIILAGSRPDAAAQLESVEGRHHPIADDDSDRLSLELRPGGLAIDRFDDGIPQRPQRLAEHRAANLIVLNGENFHGCQKHRRSPRSRK